MSTIFVGRHQGAVGWIKARRIPVDRWTDDLEPESVGPGDVVIGTLPLHLAAAVCSRGAVFIALTMDIPKTLRGKELTLADVERCGCRLEAFHVTPLPLPEEI
ncbi:MAG: CRISPR-associated protein Csx16 [Sutterella sp.]|nr:CRISPR-associated protein Csx16 [Sutterella sp.]